MTKRCHSIQDDLKAFIDKELAWPRALSVRFHLLGCEACRKEVSTMQKVTQELREGEGDVRVLDTGLRNKIMASVETAGPSISIEEPAVKPRFTLVQLLATAALIGVLAAVFFPVFSRSRENARQSSIQSDQVIADAPPSSIAAQRSAGMAAPPPMQGFVLPSVPNERFVLNEGAQLKQPMVQQPTRNASSSVQRQLDSVAAGGAVARGTEEGSAGYGPGIYIDSSPQRRVHKQASISVQVGDLESNTAAVEQMTKNVGGYIANNNLETGSGGLRRSMLTIKVPVAQFETVLAKIGKLGLIQNKQVSGEDITARVSDAEQSKKVLANQLMQQVEQLKKAKAQDKPQQRHEARMLQIQLAQARARYNVLSKLATLSTVEVQLQEKAKPKPVPQSGFMEEINKTKISATEAFMSALRIPIIVLMWVLAYSPLWIPLLIIYRLASRGHLRRSS
jgi:anti-sigma factor RsiW